MEQPAHLLNGRGRAEAPLRSLTNFFGRNRWLVLGFVPVVLAATATFLYLARPVYEAAASIRVDEERSNVAVLDMLSSLSSGSEIDTEMEELRSRTLAEEVVDSLDLALWVTTPRRVTRQDLLDAVSLPRRTTEAEIALERREAGEFDVFVDGAAVGSATVGEDVSLADVGVAFRLAPGAAHHDRIVLRVEEFYRAVRSFADGLDIGRPNREADIVVIRYRGQDSALVRAVPNEVARLFIARRNRVRRTESLSTIAFLQEQLDTLNDQLLFAENRLRAFREGERIVSPEAQAEATVGRLADLQAQRDLLNMEREGLSRLLVEVESAPNLPGDASPYRRLVAFPTLLRNPAVGDLLNNLAQVENQRAEQLMRYTLESPDVQVLTERVDQLERQLASISMTYLQGLETQLGSLDERLTAFGGELARVPATQIRYARLLREADLYEEIATLLQTRLKEAEIAAAVEDPSVRVIDPSIPPDEPVWPRPVLSLLLATLVGLSLGVGTAFAREHLDNTIHTREELQTLAAGVPVLGTIPRIRHVAVANGGTRLARVRGSAPDVQARLVTGRDPRSPASEAYRSLRTNIAFVRPEHAPRTLVFTSPAPGDGKSTSAANLAITLAQQQLRVLLIDADMRRGVLHEVFRTPRQPGLSDALLGTVGVEDAVRRVEIGGDVALDFLPMGTVPPNPAELLASHRMRALLQKLETSYDAVLLDAPPLTVVTDAALLGTHADGVILVARAGSTERGALTYSVEQLRNVRAPLLGAILNDIDARKDRYYGSYAAASYYAYTDGSK